MPIGIVSDDEFEAELRHLNVGTPKKNEPHQIETVIQDIVPAGRKEGDNNVPESLRKIIADEALLNGRAAALQLARAFDISPASVSAYTKGATSTASYHEPSSITQHLSKTRARVVKRASKTLNSALDAITQEKLDYSDAKDLAAIAKNMSGIIKDMVPEKETAANEVQSPQFVIFAPQFRDERTFEVVTVQE